MEHINKLQEAIIELADSYESAAHMGVLDRVSRILACGNCGELDGLDLDRGSRFFGKCANCGCDTAAPKEKETPNEEQS